MESWQRHCVWWGHKPGLMLTSAWEEATPLIQVWTELAQPVLQLCHRSLPACTASRLSQCKHRPTFNHLFPPHKWVPKSGCYYYFTLSCKLILIANLISLRNTCVSRASWWVCLWGCFQLGFVASIICYGFEETTGHGLIQEVGQQVRCRRGHPSRLYHSWPIPGVNIS